MEQGKSLIVKSRKIEVIDVIILLITLGIFMLSLLSFYPGIMTNDSVDQWNQISNNAYTSWHPIFHTLFEKLITIFWKSPAAIAIFQSAIFAFLLTIIAKISRNGYGKRVWLNICQLLIIICICFIPVNLIYPITLWKDVMYTFSLLALFYYIFLGIKNNFEYKKKDLIVIAIILACISSFRLNGIVVTALAFAIIFLFCIKRKIIIKFFKFLGVFILVFFILNIPTFLVNKVEGETRYKNGVYIHITGALLSEGKITEEEDINFLNTILDTELWKKYYKPYTHDGIMFSKEMKEADKLVSENSEQLRKIAIKYTIRNPLTVIKHYYRLTAITWRILPFEDANYYSFSFVTESSVGKDSPLATNPKFELGNEYIKKIHNVITNNKVLNILFYRPALHMYVAIICCLALSIMKKKKRYMLLLTPMLFNTISFLPALPAQDFRYFYINLLTMCMSVLIVSCELINYCYDNKKFRAGFLYLVFGGITTVLNIFTYFICVNLFDLNYIIANIIAWIVAVLVAYITNKFYVFESKEVTIKCFLKEILLFFGARIATLILETLFLYITIKCLSMNEMLAKIISNIIVLIANYILSKYMIFKKERGKVYEK